VFLSQLETVDFINMVLKKEGLNYMDEDICSYLLGTMRTLFCKLDGESQEKFYEAMQYLHDEGGQVPYICYDMDDIRETIPEIERLLPQITKQDTNPTIILFATVFHMLMSITDSEKDREKIIHRLLIVTSKPIEEYENVSAEDQ
jgi:predicted transcriptional regulator